MLLVAFKQSNCSTELNERLKQWATEILAYSPFRFSTLVYNNLLPMCQYILSFR